MTPRDGYRHQLAQCPVSFQTNIWPF